MIEKVLPYVSEGSWLDVGFGNALISNGKSTSKHPNSLTCDRSK